MLCLRYCLFVARVGVVVVSQGVYAAAAAAALPANAAGSGWGATEGVSWSRFLRMCFHCAELRAAAVAVRIYA
jgi:hypothetical protein